MLKLPRLYPIIDAACFSSASDPVRAMADYMRELLAGGVTLIQYRNKTGSSREMLSHARELRRLAAAASRQPPPETAVKLIMNDRADLCLAADFDGVHVGQHDLPVTAVRAIVGPYRDEPGAASATYRWVGLSTNLPEQVREADGLPVDYIAVGPVFMTGSKADADPATGLEGVRRARALTNKPLVAIGGITRKNCRQVIEAGADSVCVISDLLNDPRGAAREFLTEMGS